MKLLTKRQQRNIGVRLLALLKMCQAMARNLPIEQYFEYTEKYAQCIVDIAADVGGIKLIAALERNVWKDENV